MAESDKTSKLEGLSYFIDLDWFQGSDRSFAAITRNCLCSACQERSSSELMEMDETSLIINIKDCCSKNLGFMNSKLPMLEKIFRLFLSNGNEPLTLAELVVQLTSYSDTPTSLSHQTLKCLLDNNKYYGFRQHSRGK